MNKEQIIQYLMGLIFLVVSVSSLINYIGFRHAISESKTIEYSILEKRINKGGRGESFDLIIKFQNREQTISITSKEFDMIENGEYPELYFSKYTNSIFSKWSITRSLRLTILFFILSIFAVLPWSKLNIKKNS
jgi:hypothetical protein